ncbi:MAG: hypothetical protein EON93_09245, partial [Burkholderiales bacterium]
MSIFEFVFALYSVIGSLAIAHLLAGVAGLLRARRRVKLSWVHALWMWATFASVVGNWASEWAHHDMEAWPAWSVLLSVTMLVISYLTCYLVTPDIAETGEIDLRAFHARERVSYLSAFLALLVSSQAINFAFGAAAFFDAWLRDSVVTFLAIALVLLSLFVKATWAQIVGAAGIASLSAYFLVVSTNIATPS